LRAFPVRLRMRPKVESALDTIAALATPVGKSALALVRISGSESGRILRAVTEGLPEQVEARHPYLVSFVDAGGEVVDRGLATFFAGPASSTGEDAAEFSIHGSPIVARKLLGALIEAGARAARPGEFTERAFLLGKMDLVEAEAVRDLIESRTEAAARLSARRLDGAVSRRLALIRDDLVAAAAALGSTIDFAEDVGESLPPEAVARLEAAEEALARLSASYRTGSLVAAGCRVAILGRPNAGKSTLFNALVGSSRAIVTDVPGTTRDTLHATVDVRGVPVELVDTAGLRETEDTVEKIGVERAREAALASDAVIYVFDARAGWSREDSAAVASLDGKPATVIANKIDTLPEPWAGTPIGARPLSGIASSAGEALGQVLADMVARDVSTDSSSETLSSLRQRDLVERARTATADALASLRRGDSPEYAATHLDAALDALADIAGETTSEDVLRTIFSTFCIGK
jgi:tRNA modification GTPase